MSVSDPKDTWVTPEVRAWVDTKPKKGDMLHSNGCAYLCTLVETIPTTAWAPRHTVWHVSPVNLDGKYLDHKGQMRFMGDPIA